MELTIGWLDNCVSLLLFLLDPLTSAFIKADLRRQKVNGKNPKNVSMWELAGQSSEFLALLRMWLHRWGPVELPEWTGFMVAVRPSQLSQTWRPEFAQWVFQHCFPAALFQALFPLPALLLASLLWSPEDITIVTVC